MELYLDEAATTKLNDKVKEEYENLLSSFYGSTGSLHSLGTKSLELEVKARSKIASLLKVKENEILFNSGATEGNNFAIKGTAFSYKNRGNTIITTKVEHPSVLEACKQLEEDFNFNVIYLDVDSDGVVDLNMLSKSMSNDVILVSIMYVNHELGTIMPMEKINKIVRQYPKAILHSDITQAIGKIDVNLSLVDIATMSAHKIHGLKGSGFMYKKEKVNLYPLISGHPATNQMRAGTSNFLANIVLANTLSLALIKQKEEYSKTLQIKIKVLDKLKMIDNVVVNSTIDNSIPNTINFSLPGYNSEVIIRAMSSKGIYLSSKSVCSLSKKDATSTTLAAMKKDIDVATSSIRISYDASFSDDKIDYFIASLQDVISATKRSQ